MTEKEYNEHPGVRRSDLWKINESPEKYKWAIEHPTEPTPALIFGSAAHKLILEGIDEFDKEYAITPTVDRRTKAGKEAWERFCEKNADKTLITEDNYLVMSNMKVQLIKCKLANELLTGVKGETEVPFFWTDEDTGEECKVKLDRLVQLNGRYAVVDYKTAESARTEDFVRSIVRYGYTLQCAMYTEAVKICKGLDYRPDFIFVVQEKKEPYSVNVIYVSAESEVMLYGADQFREMIGLLHQCKLIDYYPGPLGMFGEMNEAYLPSWASFGESDE